MNNIFEQAKAVRESYIAYERALIEFKKANHNVSPENLIGRSDEEIRDYVSAAGHTATDGQRHSILRDHLSAIQVRGRPYADFSQRVNDQIQTREMMREIVLEVLAEKEVVTNTGVGGRK